MNILVRFTIFAIIKKNLIFLALIRKFCLSVLMQSNNLLNTTATQTLKAFTDENFESYLLERDSVTRFFASGFFHESSSPKPPKIKIGSYLFFFTKIWGEIRKWRVHHWYQRHQWQICHQYQWHPSGKFCHRYCWCWWYRRQIVNDTRNLPPGVNDTGGKLLPVSTTLAANLPLVSMTPVANNRNNIRLLTS